MKVKIISPVVNFPKFLDIQIEKFKQNLLCDFELICIDDSKHESMPEQFMDVCSKHDDVATWFRNTDHLFQVLQWVMQMLFNLH